MTSRLFSGRALASFSFACAVALSSPVILQAVVGSAAYAADDEQKLSPEVGKPLQAAQTAIKEKKYSEAMAKLKEADPLAKTTYEHGVIEQLRMNAAVGADEPGLAAKAYDYLSQNGGLQGQLKIVYAQAIAGSYMKAKDLGSAATWYSRYFQAGGTDLATRTALAQAYFFNNDFGNAQKSTQQAIDAYTAAGQTPTEALYNLLANCALKLNDKKTYATVLEQTVTVYPKADYWADLIHLISNKPGVSGRLSLDVYRLQDAVGALNKTPEYMEYAELAIQAGLPGEAKTVVDKGYKVGTLGAGAEAERHGRLRTMTKAKIDADQPTIATQETDAGTQPNGQALVNVGMDYYGYGQYDKAISLIQAGIAKGGLKSADEAKLHLGIVQLAAGKKADGLTTLKSIKSGDAVNDLARLWIIKANSHAAG